MGSGWTAVRLNAWTGAGEEALVEGSPDDKDIVVVDHHPVVVVARRKTAGEVGGTWHLETYHRPHHQSRAVVAEVNIVAVEAAEENWEGSPDNRRLLQDVDP